MVALGLGCGSGGSGGVAVETYNVALAGAFVPFEAERRAPLAEAIANLDADIVCLQEVWTQADKEMIRDAAASRFPHVVIIADDLDTPLDDATDQEGATPPAPTTVPCPDIEVNEGVTVEEEMNAAIDCVSAGCSTMPGSEDGKTTSTTCAADACTFDVAPLLLGNAQQQRCYSCLVTQLPTSTFGEIRASCPTVINQELAFGGQNGVMILSRHPLKDAAEWVVPGTWNRRVIMNATAELPDGSELDVYCNHLTPIFDDLTLPYTGQYGDGMTGPAGWEAEQFLQAEKLIDYVQSISGTGRAVIMGDLNAGRAFPEASIVAEGAPTLDLLETVFAPGYEAAYEPTCTFCTSNPITDTLVSVWIDHILLHNIAADAVTATKRTFDENVLSVGGEMIPLSDHYGIRSVLSLPAVE